MCGRGDRTRWPYCDTLIAMDEKPPLESDSYLESLLTEDLTDANDSDITNVVGLEGMA